jgi:hypothetical protein
MSTMAGKFERLQLKNIHLRGKVTDLFSSPSRRSSAGNGGRPPLLECEIGHLLRLAALCHPHDEYTGIQLEGKCRSSEPILCSRRPRQRQETCR